MKLKLMEVVSTIDYLSEDKVKEGVASGYVQDWAYILHDKDVTDDGGQKKAHYHVLLRLKDSTDTKYIASAFGLQESQVSKVKGRWVDGLLYLTHKNAPEKYQYSDEDVKSNFDFAKVRNKEMALKNTSARLKEIIEGIDNGQIREYNIYEHISMYEYTMYEKKIKSAFKYRIDRLKGINRKMECIYIYGDAGSGKTTYAKMIAEEKHMTVFVSSGSNDVLDGYRGEDCIILDDLRPSCLGLSDLLKMLDNNTASSVKSRYQNKVLECKLIIITTTKEIDDFFEGVFEHEREPIVQLKRRCTTLLKMDCEHMKVFAYNPKLRDYKAYAVVDNPCKLLFQTEEVTEEQQREYLQNLLGGTVDLAQGFKNDLDDFVTVGQQELPFT